MTTVIHRVQERKAIAHKYLLVRRMIIKTPCIIALMVSENGRAARIIITCAVLL